MKSIKTLVAAVALSTLSFGAFAQSASGTTIDDAEAKIAAQAEQAGASSYKITEANVNNTVHMTAELYK